MEDRAELSTEEQSSGSTQEWVPAALRDTPALGGPQAPVDEPADFIVEEHPPEEEGEGSRAYVDEAVDPEDEDRPEAEAEELPEVAAEDPAEVEPVHEPEPEPAGEGEPEASGGPIAKIAQALRRTPRTSDVEHAPDAEPDPASASAPPANPDPESEPTPESEPVPGPAPEPDPDPEGTLGVRIDRIEHRLEALAATLERTAETTEGLAGALQRSGEQTGQRLADLEGFPADDRELQEELMASLESRLNGLEQAVSGEEARVSERFAVVERLAVEREGRPKQVLAAMHARLKKLEAGVEATAGSHREAVDALSEDLGTRAAETSNRLAALEQRVGEMAVELASASERDEDVRTELRAVIDRVAATSEGRFEELREIATDAGDGIAQRLSEQITASLERAAEANERITQLAGEIGRSRVDVAKHLAKLDEGLGSVGETNEERIATLDRRLSEGTADRAERLAPLERGLDELGVSLQRTRSAFVEREKARHASLQRRIDEISTALNERLERTGSTLARQVEALREELPPPVPSPPPPRSLPPAFPPQTVAAEAQDADRETSSVADGDTVRIPSREALDVNEASFEQLRALGLSVTQTSRLLDFRSLHGRFEFIDELDSLPGFPDGVREGLKSLLVVTPVE